ncbi:MAG: PilZ domain-containing protein [Bdellovibrionia bacterium]
MSGRVLAKRRFPRRRFRRPIGVLFDGVYSIGRGEEIGEGGLSIAFNEAFKEGKNLLVTFALEDELHVMRGEVRYAKTQGQEFILGIAFQNISFKFKKLIRRYIGAKSEQELDNERQERADILRATDKR